MKKINIKKSYNNDLIKLGSKSDKFKKLPKNIDDLSMAEFMFLCDYINKGVNNIKEYINGINY